MAHPANEPVTRGDAAQAFPGQWAAAAPQPAVHPWRAFLAGNGRIESLERYGALAARLLLAHIFFLSALGKIMDWERTEMAMTKRGMFWVPLFLVGAIAFELGGSLSLILGYKDRRAGAVPVLGPHDAGVPQLLDLPPGPPEGADDQLHEEHCHHGRPVDGHQFRARTAQPGCQEQATGRHKTRFSMSGPCNTCKRWLGSTASMAPDSMGASLQELLSDSAGAWTSRSVTRYKSTMLNASSG
jgi:hypothetical protein